MLEIVCCRKMWVLYGDKEQIQIKLLAFGNERRKQTWSILSARDFRNLTFEYTLNLIFKNLCDSQSLSNIVSCYKKMQQFSSFNLSVNYSMYRWKIFVADDSPNCYLVTMCEFNRIMELLQMLLNFLSALVCTDANQVHCTIFWWIMCS